MKPFIKWPAWCWKSWEFKRAANASLGWGRVAKKAKTLTLLPLCRLAGLPFNDFSIKNRSGELIDSEKNFIFVLYSSATLQP
jgi:hypothetical protein